MRRLGFPGARGDVADLRARARAVIGSATRTTGVAATLILTAMVPASAWAQQADGACSGFTCLLKIVTPPDGWLSSPKPAVSHATVADPASRPIGDATSVDVKSEKAFEPVKKAPKPARPLITIAVKSAEVGRLRSLAAAMPRERIRIVPAVDAGEAANADFTVSEALDTAGTRGKAKLFTEQLHIVAGDKVRTVADLAGKVVAIAGGGGSDEDAVRRSFAVLNVAVKDTPLDLANALDGLATGDIDAVVVLAPQPVTQLESIKVPGLHLVSWPDGGPVPDGASLTSIESDHYPSLVKPGETIRTVGVDAVLTMSAKGAKDPAARAFLGSLSQKAAALSRHGSDRLKADAGQRSGSQVASADRR